MVRQIVELRIQWLRSLLGPVLFAHYSGLPPDRPLPRRLFEYVFMVDQSGGEATFRLSLGDDRIVHWLFNLGRITLLLVAIAAIVALGLRRHGGGFIARSVAAWGAIALAAAATGAATSAVFVIAVDDRRNIPLVAQALSAAGYGLQWALVFGLPVAIVAGLLARPQR